MNSLLKRTALFSLIASLALTGCKLGEVGPSPKKAEPPVPPAQPTGELIFNLTYDEAAGNTQEQVSKTEVTIANQFNSAERVAGIHGNALRTDGFSTFLDATFAPSSLQNLTLETWVALESYPSDAEVPYSQHMPSALLSQFDGSKGFTLDINTWGEYSFKVNVGGSLVVLKANEPFPLHSWTHLAAVVDATQGAVTLFLNGVAVATTSISKNKDVILAQRPLRVGKSHTDRTAGIFLLNGLNGAFDDTRIYNYALSASTLLGTYQSGSAGALSSGLDAIKTPASRFASDALRPRFHAMPPAGWTNEPHGLVRNGGELHMFYQRTPNGPFKTQSHWGHMVSEDFVNWRVLPDALYPTLNTGTTAGFDMKGIWAGDTVISNGKAYAFYTNVNHSSNFNPGISLATSDDTQFMQWEKQQPLIDSDQVQDFRDPYLWEENGTWHMLIGAKVQGKGGLAHYTSNNLLTWIYQPNFCSLSFAAMDVGSDVWELPVFESIGNGKHILLVNPVGGSVSKYDNTNPTRGFYWIGTWANGLFTPDYVEPKKLDLVRGHLSPTVERTTAGTLTAIGIVDERRSSQAQLNAGWANTFGLAREWYLLPDNATLGQRPSADLAALRTEATPTSFTNLSTTDVTPTGASGRQSEFVLTLDNSSTAERYGFEVMANSDRSEYTRIYYDAIGKRIVLDKRNSTTANEEDKVQLIESYDEVAFGKPTKFHVFIDGSVVDVFINDAAAFSFRSYPSNASSNGINIFASQGTANFSELSFWSLKSIALQ
jgi:sucrose-6-phosphate hydrolase SacC (GH32 family)